MKKTVLLKFFFTGLLLTVIFFKINIHDVSNTILSLNPVYTAAAILLVPVLILLRTLRWNLFLNFGGIVLPFSESLKALLIGNFYGLITPGHLGEIGRAFHLDERKVITLPTIILEKSVDICTLLGLSLITILIFFPENFMLKLIIVLYCSAIFAGYFLMLNKNVMQHLAGLVGIDEKDSELFSVTIHSMVWNFPLLGLSFFLSMIYYFIAYMIAYLVIIAAGFDPITCITLPIIILIGNIPLTIAGLGLRESVSSVAFTYLGESAVDGFVFALVLFVIISVPPALAGYALVMHGGNKRQRKTGQMTGLLSPYLERFRVTVISNIIKGNSVLDYGCGRGSLASSLIFTKYTGTDLDPSVVCEARREYSSVKNVSFCTTDEFEKIQESYDTIVLSAVIEHFPDPVQTLENLVPLLENQGKIIITTPTPLGNTLLKFGSMLGIFSRSAFEEHNRIFTKKDFLELAEKLNLRLTGYDTFEFGLNQVVILSRE